MERWKVFNNHTRAQRLKQIDTTEHTSGLTPPGCPGTWLKLLINIKNVINIAESVVTEFSVSVFVIFFLLFFKLVIMYNAVVCFTLLMRPLLKDSEKKKKINNTDSLPTLKCFMMMSYLTMVPPWSCPGPGPGPGPEELGSSKAPPPLSYSLGSVWRANRLSGWSTNDVLQQRNIKQHLHNSAPADVWSGLSPHFSLWPSGGWGQRSASQSHRVESLNLKVVWVFYHVLLVYVSIYFGSLL